MRQRFLDFAVFNWVASRPGRIFTRADLRRKFNANKNTVNRWIKGLLLAKSIEEVPGGIKPPRGQRACAWRPIKGFYGECGELIEELRINEQLLKHREELLAAIPECPVHGAGCVPHAIEWVETAKELMLARHAKAA